MGDLIDNVRRRDAAEAARQEAIAPLQQPHTATNGHNRDRWLETTFHDVVEDVRNTPVGNRNGRLRWGARRLGEISWAGLDEQRCKRELERAAQDNGIWKEDGAYQCKATIENGWAKGVANPDDLKDVGTQQRSTRKTKSKTKAKTNGEEFDDEEEPRRILLRSLNTVRSRVPQWVWKYDDVGRIQLGTLTMFAGKPTAGKSTAVRWFAARLSKGELEGCWHGHPMRVAVMMTEEQLDAVVVPGLQAAGAYMENIVAPEFIADGVESAFQSIADEQRLTEELRANEVRALFVDPVMTAISGRADVNRANEVRQYLAPFTRIAKAINGIVVCVAHLRKGQVNDVLGGINGSSAFGEVPRAVFGFAPMDLGAHVMEQVKNSAGPAGLKLEYHLPIEYLTADDGLAIELPRFEIRGETEISITDIDASRDESTGIALACQWLHMYLEENPNTPSATVKRDAKQHGDIGERMIVRACQRIGVVVRPVSLPGKPYTTVWCLPGQENLVPRS